MDRFEQSPLDDTKVPAELQAEIERLHLENLRLRQREESATSYVRDKIDQMLRLMGTLPLKPEELDDETLLSLDPIGIIGEAFGQVLDHLRHTNEQLTLARDEIRAIFDAAGAGILVLDRQLNIQAFNPKSREFFFPGQDNVLGKSFREIVCPPEGHHQPCLLERVLATERMLEQSDIISKGRCFHVVGTPVRGHQGEISQVILVYTDITERKLAEKALAESETRYRDLFENASDLIQSVTPNGAFAYVNRAWLETLGYRHEEIPELNVRDIISPDCLEHCMGSFRRLMQGEDFERLEAVFRTKDGRDIVVEGNVSCQIREGKPIATRGIFRDVSERKKFETALRQSEQRHKLLSDQFQALFEGIPDPMVVLTPDLRVIWANGGAQRIFKNRNLGPGSSDPCHRLMYGISHPCGECAVLECIDRGEMAKAQTATADGRIWDIRAFPIKDDAGEVRRVIKLMHDITDQIRLQQETVRTGQLAALGELAAGVAHEINNPINGIINYAQILVNRSSQEDHTRPIAERIIHEGDRIATIVGNLLSFARERKEEKQPVALATILNSTLSLIETQLNKTGIQLYLDLAPNLPRIIARPQQIEQVLLNLVSNARYALDQKYPQPVPDKKIELQACMPQPGTIRIVLTDYGTGIPRQTLNKVLNPFFSTKPPGQGTGLGLSISHGIIGDHQGQLQIESEPGAWTRVSIELPADSR